MAKLYALVNKDKNKIKTGPIELPNAWTNPETNINHDLSVMSDANLSLLNWLPYNITGPTDIGTYDSHLSTTISFSKSSVEATNVIIPFDLEDTKEIKKKEIDGYRDSLVDGGVIYGTKSFDSDELAQRNVTGAVSSVKIRQDLGVTIDPIPWTALDNTTVPLEGNELIDFGLKLAEFVSICYQTGRVHKNNMLSLTTVQEVKDYDFTIGWPSNNLGGTISSLTAEQQR